MVLEVEGTGVLAGEGLPLEGELPMFCGCMSPVTSFLVIEDTAQPAHVSEAAEGVDGVEALLGLSRPVSTMAESGCHFSNK